MKTPIKCEDLRVVTFQENTLMELQDSINRTMRQEIWKDMFIHDIKYQPIAVGHSDSYTALIIYSETITIP